MNVDKVQELVTAYQLARKGAGLFLEDTTYIMDHMIDAHQLHFIDTDSLIDANASTIISEVSAITGGFVDNAGYRSAYINPIIH